MTALIRSVVAANPLFNDNKLKLGIRDLRLQLLDACAMTFALATQVAGFCVAGRDCPGK